jgi:dihydrofolate synthase/folylpolyglutamate synthase
MRRLLDRIGNPERAYPAIHVVGTNGKSTATRTLAVLLRAEGRRAGAYTSPHVSGWSERIWVDGAEADFERAVSRVRPPAEALGATQFEVLTAAAFAEFARRDVDVAVVEAGLGGRLDATNVVDAEVVLLTNVSLEHTDVLGDTREQIAREKLAVAHAARVVVLSDNEFVELVPKSAEIVTGGVHEAAEAFLGRRVDSDPPPVHLPGRLDARGRELWDGAHTPAGTAWLRTHVDERFGVVVTSMRCWPTLRLSLRYSLPLSPRAPARSRPRTSPNVQLHTFAASRRSAIPSMPSSARENRPMDASS